MWASPCLLLPLFFLSLSVPVPSFSSDHRPVYIVYLGEHSGLKTSEEIHSDHHCLLLSVKNSEDEARESILYSYKFSINGFAAFLTETEASQLSEMERVVSVFPSLGRSSPHTTRSWEFLGLEEGLIGSVSDRIPSKAEYGKDVIVGMIDSGIWPESKSFSDEGLGPTSRHWRGTCEEGDAYNSSHCNRKVIGARYYLKGYEAYYGTLNTSYAYRSPRDHDGHGTHTASTVAGRVVRDVSALGAFALGTVSGGASLAQLAIYKVCWPIPGPNPNIENTCFDADMLAGIDDAISDGVHVISISIGAKGEPSKFPTDGIALGALHAEKHNIVVVCSGGNSGPALATVSNLAPWLITVGASSIDRSFDSPVVLGNGMELEGQTVTPYKLNQKQLYPLVYAGDVEAPDTPSNASGQCLPNSLVADKVEGKVVLCFRGLGLRTAKGLEVKRALGAAILLGNAIANGNEIPVDAHVLPGSAVSSHDAIVILEYINSTRYPQVMIGPACRSQRPMKWTILISAMMIEVKCTRRKRRAKRAVRRRVSGSTDLIPILTTQARLLCLRVKVTRRGQALLARVVPATVRQIPRIVGGGKGSRGREGTEDTAPHLSPRNLSRLLIAIRMIKAAGRRTEGAAEDIRSSLPWLQVTILLCVSILL